MSFLAFASYITSMVWFFIGLTSLRKRAYLKKIEWVSFAGVSFGIVYLIMSKTAEEQFHQGIALYLYPILLLIAWLFKTAIFDKERNIDIRDMHAWAIVTTEGKVLDYNKAYRERFIDAMGRSKKEFKFKNVCDIWGEIIGNYFIKKYKYVAKHKQPCTFVESIEYPPNVIEEWDVIAEPHNIDRNGNVSEVMVRIICKSKDRKVFSIDE